MVQTAENDQFDPRRRDRRAHVRVGIRVRVRMAGATGLTLNGWARNIGEGGIYLETDDYFPVGSECILTIPIREGDTLHQITVTGRVRHHNAHAGSIGMGLGFMDISDADRQIIARLVAGEIPGAEPAG